MTTDEDGHIAAGGDNPFPGTAVASIFDLDLDVPTIETPAIRSAVGHLDAYLDRGATSGGIPGGATGRGRDGTVVAIVGDYGTGKTHLVTHLLRRVDRAAGPDVRHMYIDAQAGTFLALYRGSFVTRLKQTDVRRRVRDYYAEIVADSLQDEAFPAEVTRRLRDGRIDPQKFVQQFGLMESTFLNALREELHRVTRNEEFSTALMLLLRGGFDREVWEWFGGAQPDPLLTERGVTTAIESDTAALEAIGVFAILYGGHDRRFILVIDELERVLSTSGRPPAEAIDAFKTLLTVARNAGVFLVLAGLPDFLAVLGENVRDRVGPIVQVSPLTSDEVFRYVEDSIERVRHRREAAPFSRESIGYLTWLAGGNARRVIQLCHACYRLSDGTETVGDAMVREAARGYFQFATLEEVRAQVRRVLDTAARAFESDHPLPGPGAPRVDFWIPVGRSGAGCVVILSDSVLSPRQRDVLRRRAADIAGAAAEIRSLLVVNGYLTPEFAPGLGTAFTEPPLVYEAKRFAEDFEAALRGMEGRLQGTEQSDLEVIRGHVERMTQMQTSTQRFVEQLALQIETMRSVSDQQLARIQGELDALTGGALSGAPAGAASGAVPLPAEVERLFAEALAGLEGLTTIDAVLKDAFDAGHGGHSPPARVGRALLNRLSDRSAFDAVGVAALAQTTVGAFREAVREWYTGIETRDTPAAAPSEDDRARLNALCRTYESVFEYLPLFRLDELAEAAAHLPGHVAERKELIDVVTRPYRRADIRATLDGLGTRVLKTALDGFDEARAI